MRELYSNCYKLQFKRWFKLNYTNLKNNGLKSNGGIL